jgi:hypothetical protein
MLKNALTNVYTKIYYKLPDLRLGDYVIISFYFGATAFGIILLKNFMLDSWRTVVHPYSTQFWSNRVVDVNFLD